MKSDFSEITYKITQVKASCVLAFKEIWGDFQYIL